MTNRERWIVYPLLAFALMMGMRSNFQPRMLLRARSIECAELKVSTINGKPAGNQSLMFTIPMVNQAVEAAMQAIQGKPADTQDASEAASTDDEAEVQENASKDETSDPSTEDDTTQQPRTQPSTPDDEVGAIESESTT